MSSSLLDLVVLLFLLASNGAMSINYTKPTKQVSMLRLAKIQRHLDKINKSPVKSIESPDGDIIDCVLRHRQPALDHPLLKNHKIQTVAPPRPRLKEELQGGEKYTTVAEEVRSAGTWQAWQHHATEGQCPEGTVPIRRTTVDDILRAKSMYHYGKKQPRMSTAANTTTTTATRSSDAPQGVIFNEHEYAIVSTENPAQMYGAKATINVWDPTIGDDNEFSLAQIWVVSGSYDHSDLNTIEAGWQVYPQIYGDKNTRLFVYWTSDAYKSTGCYNLRCSGFVQTSNKIAVGASISPVSSYSGPQYQITILIWKDPKLGHWWISYEGVIIGYWPSELFTQLKEHAATVQWGGEVLNKGREGRHTSTQMGSGHFAEEGFGRASYFRNLQVVGGDNILSDVQSMSTPAGKANCYNIKSNSSSSKEGWGTYFYFGGPGNNPNCP